MKQKYCSFIGGMLFLSLLILGCPKPPKSTDLNTTPTPPQPDNESYHWNTGFNLIISEHEKYFFTPSEKRRIYVGGCFPVQENNNNKSNYVARLLAGTKEIDTKNMTNAPNLYFDWNYWNVFFDAYMTDGITTYYVELLNANGVSLSNPPQPVEFTQIAKREYAIEYSYAPSYDIFSYGTTSTDENMRGKIDAAFAFAGTSIIMNTYRTDLPTKINYNVNYIPQNPNLGKDEQLLNWALSTRSGGDKHLNHDGPLFSLQDLTFVDAGGLGVNAPPSWDDGQGKITIGISFNVFTAGRPDGGGSSIVFIDRINQNTLTGADKKREFDRTVVHELGHQRGIGEPNGDHTLGHNGIRKKYCIMFNPDNFDQTTADGKALLVNYRRTALFCEGHQQKLYNSIW